TPADLPRLFSSQRESNLNRVARLSAAAVLYSVDKKRTAASSRVLSGRERTLLDDLCKERAPRADVERTCPHCRLLYGTVYDDLRSAHVDLAKQNGAKRAHIT